MHFKSNLPSIAATALVLTLFAGCNQASSTPTATEKTPPNTTSSNLTTSASPATNTSAANTITEQTKNNIPPTVFAENNIAIRGADPMAYFNQDQYVAGNADYTHEWAGATWQFASAENRDLFANSPTEYAPQYGGFCAWAVSQGYTASIEPTAWKIVDNKLYLNYDARIQRRWQQDIPGNIAQADQNWPGVLN
ncbi:MAG: YHS domain-containing (seleno)protein [Phormidesmis sp.]